MAARYGDAGGSGLLLLGVARLLAWPRLHQQQHLQQLSGQCHTKVSCCTPKVMYTLVQEMHVDHKFLCTFDTAAGLWPMLSQTPGKLSAHGCGLSPALPTGPTATVQSQHGVCKVSTAEASTSNRCRSLLHEDICPE